jgi:hypothetical protein
MILSKVVSSDDWGGLSAPACCLKHGRGRHKKMSHNDKAQWESQNDQA